MTVYDFEVKKPDGGVVRLDIYRGKVLLIVNTASYCGYTKQLMGLERSYRQFRDQGFEVLAFPANQFRNQEPDPIDRIVRNYHEKYGVTFSVFDKILVNGPEASPLFQFLKSEKGYDPNNEPPLVMRPIYKAEDPNYKESPDIKWNFTKFLVDRQGNVRFRFEPEQTPSHLDESIQMLLAEPSSAKTE